MGDWFADDVYDVSHNAEECESRKKAYNKHCGRHDASSHWSAHGNCGPVLGASSAKKVAEQYSCGDPGYEAFAAYWDAGDCGHFGDDHNGELCGGIHSGECPEIWEGKRGDIIRFDEVVEAKHPGLSEEVGCLKARLKYILKSEAFKQDPLAPYVNDVGDNGITLKKCDAGCSYRWHAQYECIQKRPK